MRSAIAVISIASIVACGGDQVSASDSETQGSTTQVSSSGTESGTHSVGESGTETGTETETGEPENVCSTCSDDELCVARADDSCGPDFGYTLECVPLVPTCLDNACASECLEAVCGNDSCPPPCGQVPGVDVWCGHSLTNSCDPLLQDCPEGEKCVPFANDGVNWNDNKCVPVLGDNMPGEPCMYGGIVEATDDCDGSSTCFGVDDVGMGSCYAFCNSDESCADSQHCMIANDGTITICVDTCVPHHADNCGAGEVCLALDGPYLCTPIPSLEPNAVCMPGQVCAAGQTCVAASELDACGGDACCTDWCDTAEPDGCVAPLSCQPAFAMGQAPAGLETAGVCKLP